jgi:hypothetical protein
MELMQLLPHDFRTSRDVVSVLAQRLIAMALHVADAPVVLTSMPVCNFSEMIKPESNALARLLQHLDFGVLRSFVKFIPNYGMIHGYRSSDAIHDAIERGQRFKPGPFPSV